MAIDRDESLCKYNGGSCPNKRAERGHGRGLLRVCEIHRRRANAHQKKYQQLKKKKKMYRTTIASTTAQAPTDHLPIPTVAESSGPLVVFVLANGDDVGASLERLSTASKLSIGQPFQVISGNQLSDLLRRIERGEAIAAAKPPENIGVLVEKPELDESKASAKETPAQDLEPLPLEFNTDAIDPLVLDDMAWLSDLLA
jgi:hypothetical protein